MAFGPSNAYCRAAESADFDGDGTLDIAMIDQSGGSGNKSLAIVKGGANNTFGTMTKIDYGNTTNQTPYGLLVADIDHNGRADFISRLIALITKPRINLIRIHGAGIIRRIKAIFPKIKDYEVT